MTDQSVKYENTGRWQKLTSFRALGAVAMMVLMVPAFTFSSENFMTLGNITNIGLQSAILLLIALPMTFIILSEGLDLSPGAVLSLCGVVLALVLAAGYSLALAALAAILVGLVFGVSNGLLVAVLGMPPFVVTLGTSGMAYGVALVVTGGNAVSGLGETISAFNDARIFGVPLLIIIAALTYAVFHILLYRTRFGRYVVALGGNKQALTYAGVKGWMVHTSVYALGGMTAGVAAISMIARTNAGHPAIALGMEFDAIAAVVLGGTSFERGNGWLFGTLLGVLAIGILRNGLNLLAVDTSVQVVAIGFLVLSVLLIERFGQGKVV